MNSIVITLFVIVASFKNIAFGEGDDNFFVVSTNKPPAPAEYQNLNERLSKVELYLDIRSALNILNETITELQKTKREYVEEVEAVLDKKLKRYDKEIQNLQEQLTTAKSEITCDSEKFLSNVEQKMDNQLAKIREELSKAKQEIIAENDQNIRKHLEQMKNELTEKKEKLITEKPECENLPQDCRDVQKQGRTVSGIYRIHPQTATDGFLVWCDMTTKAGGWTYILNRFNGTQKFNLNWTDYKQGFGSVSAEHWLGLQHLYELSYNKSIELLFELVDWDLKKFYAKYDNFAIGDKSEAYLIKSLGNYTGDVRNSFKNHVNRKFSTADLDNAHKCASYHKAGWWYSNCYAVLPTGLYLNKNVTDRFEKGMHWETAFGKYWNPKELRIMIRPHGG